MKCLGKEEISVLAISKEGFYLFLFVFLEKITDLTNFEKRQAQRLKEIAHKLGTLGQQAQILCQLGFIHFKKMDYLKGIGLLNAARVRAGKSNIARLIQWNILRAELAWVRSLSDIKIASEPVLDWRMERANKEDLVRHRDRARQETTKILQAQGDFSQLLNFQKEIQRTVIIFINQLLDQCFLILGQPTFEYAILGLGSLGLGEATLHSDLEWAIVLAEDKEEHRTYMQHLATLLHLKILNLGETIIPSLAVPSLNDYENPISEHLYDDLTLRGFAIDGQMRHACKTPLGRSESKSHQSKSRRGFYLIGTPTYFSRYFTEEWFEDEPQLVRVLLNTCLITGSAQLRVKYHEQITESLSSPAIQERLGRFISNIADSFGMRVGMDSDQGKMHDLKFNFYRLPSLAFTLLTALSNDLVRSPTTIDRIAALSRGLNLSPESTTIINELQETICFIYMLRLHCYLDLNRQTENLAIQSQHTQIFFTEAKQAKTYHQLIALYDALKVYLRSIERDDFPSPDRFLIHYGDAEKNKTANQVVIHLALYEYEKAIQCLRDTEVKKSNFYDDLINKIHLIKIHRELRQYTQALKILAKLMGISVENLNMGTINDYMKKNFLQWVKNAETYCALVNLFINVGEIYRGLLQYKVAVILLENLLKYWSICQKIESSDVFFRLRGSILNALGLSYIELRDKEKAISNLKQALADELQAYQFCSDHPNLAGRYTTLGMCLIKFGSEAKGMQNIRTAIAILKSSRSEYSMDAALIHSNLGYTWTERGKWSDAEKEFDKAITIVESPHFSDQAHPHALLVYDNIGHFYYKQKNYPKSIFYYKKVLRIAKKIDELIFIITYQKKIAECYILLSIMEMKLVSSTVEKAFQVARKACQLMEVRNYRGLTATIIFETLVIAAFAAANLQNCWEDGTVESLIIKAEEKIPVDIKQKDKENLANFYNIKGCFLSYQLERPISNGKSVYDQALECFEQAKKYNRELRVVEKNIKQCQERWKAYQRKHRVDKKSRPSTQNSLPQAFLFKSKNNAPHSQQQNKSERKIGPQNPSTTSSASQTAITHESHLAEQVVANSKEQKDKKKN